MIRSLASLILVFVITCVAPQRTPAVTIPTVPVGDPGNTPHQNYGNTGQFGAVAYFYRIGTTEVTNAQYVDFLNAKAKSDPLGLYNAEMGSNVTGGITQMRVLGSAARLVEVRIPTAAGSRFNLQAIFLMLPA